MEEHMDYYEAMVRSVCDGRTCVVDLDYGIDGWKRDKTAHLARINVPEIVGVDSEVGLVARDFLQSQIMSRPVRVQVIQADVEDACHIEMWLKSEENGWINVNDLMVNAGQAVYTAWEPEVASISI